MKKQLGIAAGALCVAGLGAFWYATKIEAHSFRLEKLRLRTRNGGELGASPPSENSSSSNGNANANAAAHSTDDGNGTANGTRNSNGNSTGNGTANGTGNSTEHGTGDGTGHGNGHKPFNRYKILHLSDLHLHDPESKKIDFLREITKEDYDLIVFTGDVFEDYSGMRYASEIISKHGKLGTYAVLGNHDYYDYSMKNKILGRIYRKWRHPPSKRDVEPIVKALTDAGIQVLRNECKRFPEQKLHLIGLDYPGTTEQRMQEMTEQAQPGDFILSLFHVPRRLDRHQRAGVHLALAGHTHGGQIRVPGYGAIITDSELGRREASGLVWKGDTAFHVSRGLSADPRTNIRFFCPPVATVIEVTHVHDAAAVQAQMKAMPLNGG